MHQLTSRTPTRAEPVVRSLTGGVLASMLVLALAGCSGVENEDSPSDKAAPDGSGAVGAVSEATLGHVHGLGVDPGDGTLYVASHLGVFRVPGGGTPERIADRYQDTMGFAVVGPGQFLGSGHPDMREDLPSSLGLIESTDGAETWRSLSLQGTADLHAIEAVGDLIYGYDSQSGALIVSDDRSTWDTISVQPLYDLAANPAEPETVYATTNQGVLVASTDGSEPVPVAGAPVLTGVDWQPGGALIGVAPDGVVMISNDAITWRQAGSLDGPTDALDAIAGRWHAATASGVYESTDDGQTWDLIVANNG